MAITSDPLKEKCEDPFPALDHAILALVGVGLLLELRRERIDGDVEHKAEGFRVHGLCKSHFLWHNHSEDGGDGENDGFQHRTDTRTYNSRLS